MGEAEGSQGYLFGLRVCLLCLIEVRTWVERFEGSGGHSESGLLVLALKVWFGGALVSQNEKLTGS